MKETPVCAVATPNGHSAIGVIRLTGKGCLNILDQIFLSQNNQKKILSSFHRKAVYGKIMWEDDIIDEVIVIPFNSPHSYTGEESAEIHAHGNPVILKKILFVLYEMGFIPARPGEFTRRALLNGKITITESEAIRSIIEARSEREVQKAFALKNSRFAEEMTAFRAHLIEVTADCVAELDFSDEGIEFTTKEKKISDIQLIALQLEKIIKDSKELRLIKQGVDVVIVGPPNAGKSSLLNYLVGTDRAIVSETPGTTRDFIEVEMQIDGVLVRFIDTAGLRDSRADNIEAAGMEKSMKKFQEADFAIFMIDSCQVYEPGELHIINDLINNVKKPEILFVLNKCDMEKSYWKSMDNRKKLEDELSRLDFSNEAIQRILAKDPVYISIKNQIQLPGIMENVKEYISNQLSESSGILLGSWQEELLIKISRELNGIIELLNFNEQKEIVVSRLNQVVDYFGELTGEISNEDLLDSIFSRFCIGK